MSIQVNMYVCEVFRKICLVHMTLRLNSFCCFLLCPCSYYGKIHALYIYENILNFRVI